MPDRATDLRDRIASAERALAAGVQQTRFADGSSVTRDLAQVRRGLEADRAELAELEGAPRRARVFYQQVVMRR